MITDTVSPEVHVLESQLAALHELLAIQERVVVEQSARLEQTLLDLRATERIVRDSEERLRLLVETINDVIWEIDLKGVYTYVSPKVRELLGYEPEEMVGKRPFDFMPPEQAALLLPQFAALKIPTGPFEATLLHRDGHPVGIEVSAVPFFTPDGSLIGYRGADRDITERKRAEMALRESERKYRTLVENLPQKVFLKDKDSVYVSCNENYALDLGIGAESIAGKTDCDFHPRELAEKYAADDKRVMESGQPTRIEEKYVQDGQERFVETVKTPVRDEDGNTLGVLGIFWDITERKRAEEALRESEGKYRLLVENQTDLIVKVDLQGRFLFVSPSLCKTFGVTEGELLGEQFQLLTRGADGEVTPRTLDHLLGPSHSRHLEQRAQTKDGWRWLAWVLTTMTDDDNKPAAVIGVGRDITERKLAQDKLKRYAAELSRANEEVKQFAYIVSHDLRAPLINLKGFATELRLACTTLDSHVTTVLSHLSEEQQRDITTALQQDIPQALEFISASVTRMDSFINSVLTLSRLGRRELTFDRVCLHEVVQQALDNLAHRIAERQIKVTVGPLPEVSADRMAMEQIIGNILTNAVIYLDPNRPGEIEIAGEQRGGETTIAIRDNGRGIAEFDLPKVFALFRRAGPQDVKGEGMGLAYAQTLAQRHGGYIRCDSELGVGTTFTVVLSNHHTTEEESGNAEA